MRLPAEWEGQRATLLAWPDAGGDWADRLPEIQAEYRELIERILPYQPVIALVQSADRIGSLPCVDHPDLHPVVIPYNDTWCRDYGPICLAGGPGHATALDFRFDAWGGKYESRDDDRVNRRLIDHPLLSGYAHVAVDLELEGGAIESDGQRRVLVNWWCLEKRLPELARFEIAEHLKTELQLEAVLGIEVPALPGDDTDGHIDTMARFVSDGRIVYQQQPDPVWTQTLESELQSLRRLDGEPYQLIGLPCVEAFDQALPANYTNFVFVNGACLVPAYGVKSDKAAVGLFSELLPDRDVIPVPARTMITQFGGPHCATMHIPELVR